MDPGHRRHQHMPGVENSLDHGERTLSRSPLPVDAPVPQPVPDTPRAQRLSFLNEVLYGLEKYAKPVKDVLLLPALPYDKRDAQTSAMIELRSEADGRVARRTDAMIAAIVINRGALLFTFNVRHFEGLEGMGLKLFSAV